MTSPPRRNCGTARVIANLLYIGCAVLVAAAVMAVLMVVVYFVWAY